MGVEQLLKYSGMLQGLLCVAVMAAMINRRAVRDFPALFGFIMVNALSEAISIPLLHYRRALHIPLTHAYWLFFCSVWICKILQLVFSVLIIFGLFKEAMRPFPGLQRIGKIVFRWVGAASFAVAVALATGPQMFVNGVASTAGVTDLATRFQQGISVLTLCLLIFVCFAIRPLGLTFRSRIFGVVLGLAVSSTVYMVEAAWFATKGAHSVYSPIYLVSGIGGCLALSVWGTYFVMPEPERRMILLPTTSPFFLWNRISEILGDAPGQVAVAGFKPEMLAPAELEMLTAATAREKVSDLEREEALIGSRVSRAAVPSRPSLALSR